MSSEPKVARDYWKDWKQMIPKDRLALPKVQQHARAIEEIENKIDALKLDEFEKELWVAKLGRTDQLDSIVLRNYYRKQVTDNKGTNLEQENAEILKKLDQLYDLRKEKYKKLMYDSQDRRGWRGSFSGLSPAGKDESRFSPGVFPFSKRFWAVIIGADDYNPKSTRQRRLAMWPLAGCVADARDVYDFLHDFLHVPKENIIILESPLKDMPSKFETTPPPATRKNILDALYSHLRDNPKVEYGDNIFIHYSGHGSEYDPGLFFTELVGEVGGIEAICPVDRGDVMDPPILDISDRELNTFLSELRDKKGPNITLSLDCCHSGGGARGEDEPQDNEGAAVRSISPLENCGDMLKLVAQDPRRIHHDRATVAATDPNWQPDETSFVALTAVQDYELAMENDSTGTRRGLFTVALLRVLRSEEGQGMTYQQVINRVKEIIEGQTPQAVGTRRDSALWFQ